MALSPQATIVDYLVPAQPSRSLNLLRNVLLIVGFSLFLALCAQIGFALPFTLVPITLQTLGVLLIGAVLGSKRGALTVLLYLAEGVIGLPFFAGWSGGPAAFVGPTAGYLWAFPVAAFVTGLLCERGLERRFLTSALAMLPGTLIIYAIGVPWLAHFLHIDIVRALSLGMVPFIPGDILKLVIAAALLPCAWLLVKRVVHERR